MSRVLLVVFVLLSVGLARGKLHEEALARKTQMDGILPVDIPESDDEKHLAKHDWMRGDIDHWCDAKHWTRIEGENDKDYTERIHVSAMLAAVDFGVDGYLDGARGWVPQRSYEESSERLEYLIRTYVNDPLNLVVSVRIEVPLLDDFLSGRLCDSDANLPDFNNILAGYTQNGDGISPEDVE